MGTGYSSKACRLTGAVIPLKVLFITALFNIRLTGALGRGIRLPFELILTNDPTSMGTLLSKNFDELVGKIEASALRKANAVIYGITEHQQGSFQKESDARVFLNTQMAYVQLFLLSPWLKMDNAVNFELAFLEYPHGDPRRSGVTSNFRAIRYTKADGSYELVDIKDSDARDARDLFEKLFSAGIGDRDEYHGWLVPDEFNRLSRVFYFVQGARGSCDLGYKIAQYVTCFEALFCTDASEMAHKLAERIAFFLGKDGDERVIIFRKIKVAYNVRSKVVHGDKIAKKLAEQAFDIARSCDEFLRKSLYKILTTQGLPEIFLGHSHQLEEYLTNMILQNNNSPAG